jgi:hypothetical protein
MDIICYTWRSGRWGRHNKNKGLETFSNPFYFFVVCTIDVNFCVEKGRLNLSKLLNTYDL